MNILYFISAIEELNDPLFRFGTYKSIILPELQAILDYVDSDHCDEQINVGLILSQHIFDAAKKKNMLDPRINYFVMKTSNYVNSIDLYKENYSSKTLDREVEIIEKVLCTFRPSIIYCYEAPSIILRSAFPEALVIDVMFGAFSRAPFPCLAAYDPCGLFGQSYIAKNSKMIRSFPLGKDELDFLREMRCKSSEIIAMYQPFKREVASILQRFDKVVMVACQIDGYFAFDAVSNYKTQYELVSSVCDLVDQNVGVLVTQHPYRNALSEKELFCLRRKYSNFMLFENSEEIPDASQFLIPYIDALVTVSSSLAFQAALWHVPVIAAGNSHINVVALIDTLDDIKKILSENTIDFSQIDSALYFCLTRYNRLYKHEIFNAGEKNIEYLKELKRSIEIDRSADDFFLKKIINLQKVKEHYLSAFREWVLRDFFRGLNEKKYSPDFLLMEISKHKIISFDLFDTLLHRPFVEPHELFFVVEQFARKLIKNNNLPFHQLRRTAEADVRRVTNGADEVTIEDIYAYISTISYLTPSQCETIKSYEKQIELDFCKIKKCVFKYYKLAKLLAVKVGIISDFYIQQDFIVELLSKNNIPYDFLFVSANKKSRKHNGSIYPLMKKALLSDDLSFKDMLHIGDNKIADQTMAQQHGIRGFVFPKAIDNLKRSIIGKRMLKAFNNPSLSTSILLGLIANRFYSAPFNQVDNDSMFRGEPQILGYMGYGPLILGFVQWIKRQMEVCDYQEVFFLSRDGYIVKKVYELLYGESKNIHYMLSSRRASMMAAAFNFDDIAEIAYQSFNPQPLEDYLKNRFGFTLKSRHNSLLKSVGFLPNSIISHSSDMKKVILFLKSIQDELLVQAKDERDNYSLYLKQIGFIDKLKGGKIALVDIGYSGTMQHCLLKIFDSAKIAGLYLLNHNHARKKFSNVMFSAYLSELDDRHSAYRHELNDYMFIFESGLSSNDGSLIRFVKDENQNIKPDLLYADSEIKRIDILNKIHKGVLDFSKDYKDYLGAADIDIVFLSPQIAEKILISFSENPMPIDASIFLNYEVENVFGKGSVSLIEYPNNMTPPIKLLRDKHKIGLILRSKWKPGAMAMYQFSDKRDTPIPSKKTQSNIQQDKINILYNGQKIPNRIHFMRIMPAVHFLDAVSRMAYFSPTIELKNSCREIIRTQSKWLSAAILLNESGGIFRSKITLIDKIIAQTLLVLWRVKQLLIKPKHT